MMWTPLLVCFTLLFLYVEGAPSLSHHVTHTRSVIRSCENPSPIQVDTTAILAELRAQLLADNLAAYIITSNNDHQGEYIPDHDMRREYISGFTGSAGDAVVTMTKAALWTDSRYYLQADDQLDCNWELIKTGESNAPSIEAWLVTNLNALARVGADAKIITYSEWTAWEQHLSSNGLTLTASGDNLVDRIWTTTQGRPPYVTAPPFVLDVLHAGESWQTKMTRVRQAMTDLGADVFLVTALDEIAWFLNLRGTDIPYSPFFRAYLLIEMSRAKIYLPTEKQTEVVRTHLSSDGTDLISVGIGNYDDVWTDLETVGITATKILLPDKYSYAMGVGYYAYSKLPADKVIFGVSPILTMRDVKSDTEAAGMRNAHIRDAVALCQFLHLLEKEVSSGIHWDELRAVEELDSLRANQAHSQGPSFGTISAFGPNSALPHYSPTSVTNRDIDDSSLYMLDSGGQYLDGTTDVTRTMHYGTPTDEQREAYTRLLIGCINLASVKFPEGQTRPNLEILIRAPLYQLGLDYGHGSTHGIGFFGGVHEAFNSTYHLNFFGSQEPGYYLAQRYGMRLENIVTVVEADVSPTDGGIRWLTFEPVTLVPYDLKLIKTELLSDKELLWLNAYYDRVLQVVGNEMKSQGLNEAYDWLRTNTIHVTKSGANAVAVFQILPLVLAISSTFFTAH